MNPLATRRIKLLLATFVVLALCWLPPIQQDAQATVERGLKRSLTTFALARTLGAGLSVALGTRVSLEPAGVGVGLAPGQALRPISDLVDKFADVMLLASVSFGVQLMLLKVGGHMAAAWLLTAVVVAWAAIGCLGASDATMRRLRPLVVGMLLVRLAVPVATLASDGIYRAFMTSQYSHALSVMNASVGTVPNLSGDPAAGGQGLLDRMKAWKEMASQLASGLENIKRAASEWSEEMVRLIVIFLLNTLLFPLAFLWICWRAARTLIDGMGGPAKGSQ